MQHPYLVSLKYLVPNLQLCNSKFQDNLMIFVRCHSNVKRSDCVAGNFYVFFPLFVRCHACYLLSSDSKKCAFNKYFIAIR